MYSAIMPRENRIRPLNSEIKITVVAQPGTEKPPKDFSPKILATIVKMTNINENKEVTNPRYVMSRIGKFDEVKKASAACFNFFLKVHLDFDFTLGL